MVLVNLPLLERTLQMAQDAMKKGLEERYPIGCKVGFFIVGNQKKPTWGTVVAHCSYYRADHLRIKVEGSETIRGVRTVYFRQIICKA